MLRRSPRRPQQRGLVLTLTGALLACFGFSWGVKEVMAEGSMDSVYLVGLRHRGEELAALCEKIPGCVVPEANAAEYTPDGNTHAEFKTELTRRHVLVEVPNELSATDLMELLIKVRAAQSNGARRVSLLAEKPLREIAIKGLEDRRLNIPLERFMNVAGASHVLLRGSKEIREIKRDYPGVKTVHPTSSFITGDTHPELRDELAALLGVPALPDPSTLTLPQTQIFYVSAAIPPINANFFTMLSDVNTLSEQGAWVDLVSPLLPYARSDKNDGAGHTVVGKLVADLVKAVAPRSITFMRAHAPQSEGFFQPLPTYHLSGLPTLVPHLHSLGVDLSLSPDNGAVKASTILAEEMGLIDEESGTLRIAIVNKQRNPKTGEIVLHGISGSNLNGRIAALTDDEIDSGGTTGKGAALATLGLPEGERAARVHAAAVFLTGSGAGALAALEKGHLASLTVTSAIPVPAALRDRITVLSPAAELAQSLAPLRASAIAQPDAECEASVLAAL